MTVSFFIPDIHYSRILTPLDIKQSETMTVIK